MVFLALRLSNNTENALRQLADRISAETVGRFGAGPGTPAFWGQQSMNDTFPTYEPDLANWTQEMEPSPSRAQLKKRLLRAKEQTGQYTKWDLYLSCRTQPFHITIASGLHHGADRLGGYTRQEIVAGTTELAKVFKPHKGPFSSISVNDKHGGVSIYLTLPGSKPSYDEVARVFPKANHLERWARPQKHVSIGSYTGSSSQQYSFKRWLSRFMRDNYSGLKFEVRGLELAACKRCKTVGGKIRTYEQYYPLTMPAPAGAPKPAQITVRVVQGKENCTYRCTAPQGVGLRSRPRKTALLQGFRKAFVRHNATFNGCLVTASNSATGVVEAYVKSSVVDSATKQHTVYIPVYVDQPSKPRIVLAEPAETARPDAPASVDVDLEKMDGAIMRNVCQASVMRQSPPPAAATTDCHRSTSPPVAKPEQPVGELEGASRVATYRVSRTGGICLRMEPRFTAKFTDNRFLDQGVQVTGEVVGGAWLKLYDKQEKIDCYLPLYVDRGASSRIALCERVASA